VVIGGEAVADLIAENHSADGCTLQSSAACERLRTLDATGARMGDDVANNGSGGVGGCKAVRLQVCAGFVADCVVAMGPGNASICWCVKGDGVNSSEFFSDRCRPGVFQMGKKLGVGWARLGVPSISWGGARMYVQPNPPNVRTCSFSTAFLALASVLYVQHLPEVGRF